MPPRIAFIDAITRRRSVELDIVKNLITANGASFCHVDRYTASIHDIAVRVDGYQKWHGAAPILSRRATISVSSISIEFEYHIDILPNNMAAEPSACDRKYFTAASVSSAVLLRTINGINLSRFSSIIIQAVIQLVAAKVRIVLRNMVEAAKVRAGGVIT